jgi:1-acyl-sn-glycerol-3-phosphate acyltransferase
MTDGGAPAAWRATAGHALGAVLFRTLFRGERIGAHHVPATGPALLVANHTGFLDGPLVFSLVPRPAHFVIKKQTFSGPIGALIEGVGQIPIDRDVGDRAALGAALAVLRRGGLVGLFPEGTRGRGDVERIHSGAAWIALQAGVPVVPVACLGTRSTGEGRGSWPPPRTRMVVDFGTPFDLVTRAGIPGRERLREATEQLRAALHDHVAQAVSRTGIALPQDCPPPA